MYSNVRLSELLHRGFDGAHDTIKTEIMDILFPAMRANLVATNFVAIRIGRESIPGSTIKIDYASKDKQLVHEIGEGQEVPVEIGEISTYSITPKKYGLRPLITKEMVEDGMFDLMQYNLEEAGYQLAKKLDTLLLAQIEAGNSSASHTFSGGTAITPANINTAIYNLRMDEHNASDLICSPAVEMDLMNIDTFVEADKAGVTNPSQGLLGRIFGLTVWVSTQVTANYAYVIDRKYALTFVEKRPVTVERYDDVTRDLSGVVLTARWGMRYHYANACCVITTS